MSSEIVQAFQRLARDTPDRPLLYLPAFDAAITATVLGEMAGAIARALQSAGISRHALVASVIGNQPGAVAAFLACRTRGGPYLPLEAGTPIAEVGTVGRQFGVAAMLLAAPLPIAGFGRQTVLPGSLTLAVADTDPGDSPYAEAAVLRMTSGSTGAPRATLTHERALVLDSRNLIAAMQVGADDVQIAAIPLAHAYGFGNLLVPALLQGTAIVMRELFVPHRLPDDARRLSATVLPGVPFMFAHFAAHPPAGGWPPTLRTLVTAGAPIRRAVVEWFRQSYGLKIHAFYGTSETGGITFDAGDDEPAGEGMVGTPLPGVTVTLVPQDGAPAGGGRVHVAGPSVIGGYADGAAADSFVDGGFLTGDLGVFDAEGRLWLSGRVSSFVNVAGRKVQPDEVERVLRTFDGVEEVRVIGLADSQRGEQLVAGLVMRGAPPAPIALRQFCAERLAAHKIPRSFVFLDEIPLTDRGKTDRGRLEAAVVAALTRGAGML